MAQLYAQSPALCRLRRRGRSGLLAGALGLALLLAGCADEFARADAVTALQTTGVSEVEAICMADTLALLDALDAANPQAERDDVRREALVKAQTRCVTLDAGESAVTGGSASATAAVTIVDPEPSPAGVAGNPDLAVVAPTEEEFEAAKDRAVATLVGVGRSELNARCVVDHVLQVDADYLLDDPEFGLGLDPFEAAAFAACLEVS